VTGHEHRCAVHPSDLPHESRFFPSCVCRCGAVLNKDTDQWIEVKVKDLNLGDNDRSLIVKALVYYRERHPEYREAVEKLIERLGDIE
jgi:hypothetical protein